MENEFYTRLILLLGEQNDKVIEKEMFIWRDYGVVMLEISTYDFLEDIFKSVE